MDYAEAIDYLMSFTDLERGHVAQASANPTMSLASVRSLLSRLNDPHTGRGTVHVTGSKGKGSTAAMIAGILEAAGQNTARFSSPHLHSFTERIAIGGLPISPEEFAAGIGAVRPAVEAEKESVHGTVSTFGVLTALFFWLTRAQIPRVNWQIVEVGLGGTFDATNVFESPDVAVVTPISLEHTAILGSTVEQIARDKAGIVKAGTTCVLASQRDPAARAVVRERCETVGAELVDVGASYTVEIGERHDFGQAFVIGGHGYRRRLRSTLLGRHQAENAATAVAVADALRGRGVPIDEGDIERGIALTRVPGRLEVMGQRPLLVADGAHNGESAETLAAALKQYLNWDRCFVVLGAARDKDVLTIASALAPITELFVCTGFRSPRARDPAAMLDEIAGAGPPAIAADSVQKALDAALDRAGEKDLVCVTGSLYVVAEARELLLGEAAARRQ